MTKPSFIYSLGVNELGLLIFKENHNFLSRDITCLLNAQPAISISSAEPILGTRFEAGLQSFLVREAKFGADSLVDIIPLAPANSSDPSIWKVDF